MKNQNTRFFAGIVIVSIMLTNLCCACSINTTIKVTATNGLDVASTEFEINVAEAGDYYEWALDAPIGIVSNNGVVLGTIDYLKYKKVADPASGIEFKITAGDTAADFIFSADSDNSPVFDPITNPRAYVSAGITLTDKNQNGATLIGLYGGGKAYHAVYNGSTEYVSLLGTFSALARKTVTESEYWPDTGDTDIINDTLYNIGSCFYFNLSAKDSAAGTSYFEVTPIPEPATIGLLGLGALSLIRRKQK